jgi:hypothetical protein
LISIKFEEDFVKIGSPIDIPSKLEVLSIKLLER